jgi:hypothetical protein
MIVREEVEQLRKKDKVLPGPGTRPRREGLAALSLL